MHGSGSGRTGKPTQGTVLASHPALATAVQEAADTGGQPQMLMEELGVLIGAGSGKILCSMGRRISGKIVWHDLRC